MKLERRDIRDLHMSIEGNYFLYHTQDKDLYEINIQTKTWTKTLIPSRLLFSKVQMR